MRKLLYIGIIVCLSFWSCGEDVLENKVLTAKTVDLSDFTVYIGSANGGVELDFNNLKKTELVNSFFKGKYNLDLYKDYSIEFNKDKLTYIFYDTVVKPASFKKIVSDYTFDKDSLFILKTDASRFLVALGTQDYLYKQKGLARFRNTILRDTVLTLDKHLDLDALLKLRGIKSINDLKDTKDTIAWCNPVYLFK